MLLKQTPEEMTEKCADQLHTALQKAVMQNGRIHVEDYISAAAAIVGETTILAAGDFDPRTHTFAPGTRVFSDKANKLICGDKPFGDAPPDTIIGILRETLYSCGFQSDDFPSLKDVFDYFAANLGNPQDWGSVPLSVPAENRPFLMPLRVVYEFRAILDRSLEDLRDDRQQRLRATTMVLAKVLCETRDALERKTATTLAIETVNGMAKTAPMTDSAMAALAAKQKP